MAAKTPKTNRVAPDSAVLLASIRARLESEGAIKLSSLGTKSGRATLVSRLVHQGFEVTGTTVRRPLNAQLTAALTHGAFIPLKSVVSHVAGSTVAEAKQAVLSLVASGAAKLVLRGTEEVVVPADAPVLSREELARFAEVAKVVAKAAKSKSGASLLRSDVAETLGHVLREAPSAGKQTSNPNSTPARPNSGGQGALVGRLLSAVDATRDPRTGLSFVPTIVAKLRPVLDAQAAAAILVAVAREGLLELRPEGGINRLSEEELSMCPPGPQGTRLSWARRTEEVGR
jgi:hypothetical protein